MTVLAIERQRDRETWKRKEFTLTGVKCWQNGLIYGILSGASAGKVTKTPSSNTIYLGLATRTIDASAADQTVTVDLVEEINIEWLANDGTITSANIFGLAYFIDDNTVGVAGPVTAGRIWAVDATLGVAVQMARSTAGKSYSPVVALPAPVAGDVIPTTIANGTIYTVPALAANSTVTLPASPPDGIEATIVADGVNNGFTVQVRDATGPTNLTAAFTASKRLNIKISSAGGKWSAVGAAAP